MTKNEMEATGEKLPPSDGEVIPSVGTSSASNAHLQARKTDKYPRRARWAKSTARAMYFEGVSLRVCRRSTQPESAQFVRERRYMWHHLQDAITAPRNTCSSWT